MKATKEMYYPERKMIKASNIKAMDGKDGYHRGVQKKNLKKIIEDFNPLLVNPIKVYQQDGQYWVFDGLTTLEALKYLFGNDVEVECDLFDVNHETAAELFERQNEYL